MFQVEYFFVKCIHTLHLLIHEVTWSCSGQNSFSLNHRLWGLLEVLKCLPWWWRRSRRTQKLFVLELSAKSDAYICLWKEAWSNRWIYVWNHLRYRMEEKHSSLFTTQFHCWLPEQNLFFNAAEWVGWSDLMTSRFHWVLSCIWIFSRVMRNMSSCESDAVFVFCLSKNWAMILSFSVYHKYY